MKSKDKVKELSPVVYTFTVTAKQQKQINKWIKELKKVIWTRRMEKWSPYDKPEDNPEPITLANSHPQLEYRFFSSGIGMGLNVYDRITNSSIEVTDLDSW